MVDIDAKLQELPETREVGKEEFAQANEVMLSMLKTSKGFRMYQSNNPLLTKFIEDMMEKISRHLSLYGEYRFEIDQFELRYRGKQLYENRDPKESVAFKMYSDGIRYFIFSDGLEEEEICGFLDIVGRDRPNDLDDDIVTLLWEKNYPHITYLLADDFLEFDSSGGTSVSSKSQQGRISSVYQTLAANPLPSTLLPIPRTVLLLTDEEIESLHKAKVEEEKRKPLDDVIQIVSSILVGEKDPVLFGEFLDIMAQLAERLANGGDIRVTADLVRFLGNLAGREEMSPERRTMIAAAMGTILSGRNVPVLAALLNKTDQLSAESLYHLLTGLGKPVIGRICELLGLVENMKTRKVILKVLVEIGGDSSEAFVPFLEDRRWYLVRNIVLILTRLGTGAALDAVVPLIAHRDLRVRREVLGYLETITDPKAKQFIVKFLRDESGAIRIRTLKILGAGKYGFALKPILSLLSSPQFAEKEIEEKKAVYEAVGDLGPDTALPLFREMLLKKYWFNRAKEKEAAVCAVAGLMRLRPSAALPVLEEGKKGKKDDVWEIIHQAFLAKSAETGRT